MSIGYKALFLNLAATASATSVVVVVVIAAATIVVVAIAATTAASASTSASQLLVGGLSHGLNAPSKVQIFAGHGVVKIHHNLMLLNGFDYTKEHLTIVGSHGQTFANL